MRKKNVTPCLASKSSPIESDQDFSLSFVLDNASTVNICGCREAFVSLIEDNETTLEWIEKSTTLEPKYKGLIKLEMVDVVTKKKVPVTIEAEFVDGATNLLSQRIMFLKHGFKSQTSDDKETNRLANSPNKWTVDFGIVDGLYRADVVIPRPRKKSLAVLVATTQSTSLALWHMRLAHTNWQAIKEMESKGLVSDLKLARSDRKVEGSCYDCDLAKMKRMSFKKTSHNEPHTFEKVFMDLGFLQVPTMEGHKVYLPDR
ncbi:hypothetical protein AM588_10000038 [Phytophthora nicotianae]|uniref:GAG-pre-integrase domain-containing protein n=1 Tax=Phytophthora nicotianae TaxID=4792 RepID=A0A0W8C0C3_PHYNI|nr:hypothetical protein AM588_10000038 [Phytophthora nicotianae]